ncbi:MAG TPA: AAA domain-containing protein, partial [Chloroflexia bacterium]|nr:AAA domain-containing protein [Chloroflexia bacterium]
PDPVLDASGRTKYKDLDLADALSRASAGHMLIQPQYKVTDAFTVAMSIDSYEGLFKLAYSELRPDILQVLPPGRWTQEVRPNGTLEYIQPGDRRLQLRVIDIKHTAEPSNGYFAEVAYYMVTLAGWLEQNGLDRDFVVVAGAVWPGSHDASALRKKDQKAKSEGRFATQEELNTALEEDLEPLEFSVFAPRLRSFLQDNLKSALETPWQEFTIHVATTCGHCEYLGHKWTPSTIVNDDHCIPTEERTESLSRIAQMTPGAALELREAGVTRVTDLAALTPADPVLDRHQTLKSRRIMFPARAQALGLGTVAMPTDVGTSAVMPKWSDLSIYVSTDFDVSSGITVAFGLRATWREPLPFGHPKDDARKEAWPAFNPGAARAQAGSALVFPVDSRDMTSERRELLAFLGAMQGILDDVGNLDAQSRFATANSPVRSSMQVYIWDSLQLKHLQRVIGRHLPSILANPSISGLTWLFPPETVLPSHELQRPSPITLVQDAVASLAALPVAHYYSLLRTVQVYHLPATNSDWFNVHPLYDSPLSDQIPSERAHEIWSRSTESGRHWLDQLQIYKETVAKKLHALVEVTRTLRGEIGLSLQEKAPDLQIRPPRPKGKMSFDGELWYHFSKLDASIDEARVLTTRAMPPYEREARFESALLTRRLYGPEEVQALNFVQLPRRANRRVYELAPGSVAVKVKPGDFSLALSPNQDSSFLNQNCWSWLRADPTLQLLMEVAGRRRWRMEELTGVTVRAIDRERRVIVLDVSLKDGMDYVSALENAGLADFGENVSLDPVSRDYFTGKLLDSLQSIGNPAIAAPEPAVLAALGQGGRRGGRPSPHTPAADFLWDARNMASSAALRPHGAPFGGASSPSLDEVMARLKGLGISLTDTQWAAWRSALTTRLRLIWGPPGTGKSRTLVAVVVGAFLAARIAGVPLRVLISAATYRAMDIVLKQSAEQLAKEVPLDEITVARVRSKWREQPEETWAVPIDLEINPDRPSTAAIALHKRLSENAGLTLVGATPGQVHNLTRLSGDVQAELFDLVLIDEASQMDVAHAIFPLCALAEGASLVLAGDPKQLPPIHQAEPPLGLESRVGSIYLYMTDCKGVEQAMLDRNYRSNKTLVDFGIEAGYRSSLTSHSPDLRLALTPAANLADPSLPPPGWPAGLYWTPAWEQMMDPAVPAVCFVYRDGRSSQWNDFETETVGALLQTVNGRVVNGLEGERAPDGSLLPTGTAVYTPDEFWRRAVGVVTPHRAQQSRITARLQALFGPEVSNLGIIRDAVDTVERFQGQQRDIIIASYALGDPDAIRNEEEFLMSLNRFNVMASRARAKLIVLVSREVIDYLASDLAVLRESALLKLFADSYCARSTPLQLGYNDAAGKQVSRPGVLKTR